MSERPLPDDLAQWPAEPNELLGVSFGVTPRDLRRAYNRLIRIYKPEQFPEEFRRIREAYEHLLQIAEWFGQRAEAAAVPDDEPQLLPPPKEKASDDGASTWVPDEPRPEEKASESGFVPARPRGPEEELEELWESAIAGRPLTAYDRLTQLNQQYAGRIDIYLRLYWLLTLYPELDSRRAPADWLVQGLLETGMAGQLQELYREEVADDPAEALGERFGRLLESSAAPGLLADLMEWRLDAAARLQRWDFLAEDVPRQRLRFGPGEEVLWLRLVFFLADRVAWAGTPEGVRLMADCSEVIARHEHLASSLSHSFDRFDLLLEASDGWLSLWTVSRLPAQFLQLIAASWSRPFAELRESLMAVLELIAGAPSRWLDHLDVMHERSPTTLSLFGVLLDRFEELHEGDTERRDRDALTKAVVAFLPQWDVTRYTVMRVQFLIFCIGEDIAPEEMAEVASGFTDRWAEVGFHWAQTLTADWPLRYVCRACRLFWT
jgi:hypothetical protein